MEKFDVIILTGRPAAGKSEVIDYLKKTPTAERLKRFHVGAFEEIDDFVFVWETFETDDILEKYGRERLLTTPDKYFKDSFVWTIYIERINLEYKKKLAREPSYFDRGTILIEFARGGEEGIKTALSTLDPAILKRAGIFYINVSYSESVRRNRKRFKPELADSILHHSLPDDKMDFYYKVNDWEQLANGKQGLISIKGISIPFAVFDNEPEKTHDPAILGPALEDTFARLKKEVERHGF